jgi:hypothetical protein
LSTTNFTLPTPCSVGDIRASASHHWPLASLKTEPWGQPMRRSVPFWMVMLRRTSMIP